MDHWFSYLGFIIYVLLIGLGKVIRIFHLLIYQTLIGSEQSPITIPAILFSHICLYSKKKEIFFCNCLIFNLLINRLDLSFFTHEINTHKLLQGSFENHIFYKKNNIKISFHSKTYFLVGLQNLLENVFSLLDHFHNWTSEIIIDQCNDS